MWRTLYILSIIHTQDTYNGVPVMHQLAYDKTWECNFEAQKRNRQLKNDGTVSKCVAVTFWQRKM
jgi:endonuclease YncB( thermonuclease family)